MPRRTPRLPEPEPIEARWLLQEQTARNLEGHRAEQEGRWEEAMRHYERNVAEGFPGDWPYGRLVAFYEKRGSFTEAERVLRRALDVFASSNLRTAADRRATIQVFRRRLKRLATLRQSSPAHSDTSKGKPDRSS